MLHSYFYRVEDSKGMGPYAGATRQGLDGSSRWSSGSHDGSPDRPTLFYEVGRGHERGQIFGFKTLRQLQSWFRPEELKRLYKLGYQIKRVRGRQIIATRTQVLFERC